nr:hypothetical protein HK105_005376 [Polyrhizophydium stewartii]
MTLNAKDYQEIRQLISCAQSWTALTRDSSNTTAMSVQLYESFNFRTCAVPSSIALSGQWFSYTAKDGTTVSLPTLLNTDSAVASVDNAVKYLDDSGPLLWLEFSIMAAFLLMSLFFSNRVRRTFVWAHFHQHGASIKKRCGHIPCHLIHESQDADNPTMMRKTYMLCAGILMRYQTMSFVLRFQIAMAIPTSAQIIVLFFYASAVGDVPKAFTPGASDVPWTPKMYVPVQVVSTLLAIVTMFAMTVVIPWILKGQRRHLFWPILIWLLVMLGSQCVFLRTVYLDSTFLNGRIWITEFLVAHILASMATIVLFWELRADMDHGLADVIQRSWGPERERMELL